MLTKKLLTTLGIAGALLVGASTDASANPFAPRIAIRPAPVMVVRPAPVVVAPAYRPVVVAPVYRPVPMVAPVYAPAPRVVVVPAPVYQPVYQPVYHPGGWRHRHWHHTHGGCF